MTPDAIRRFCLSLPETAEGDHFGSPSFKSAGKIFCTIAVQTPMVNLKLDPEDQANLAAGHPGVVEPVEGYWGRKGWTYVHHEKAEDDLVETLIRMSWAAVAPKRLLKTAP
jgi:predicted DNA-binding protein (MmcQ/YjbR family)